jgi:hypothetical protein
MEGGDLGLSEGGAPHFGATDEIKPMTHRTRLNVIIRKYKRFVSVFELSIRTPSTLLESIICTCVSATSPKDDRSEVRSFGSSEQETKV